MKKIVSLIFVLLLISGTVFSQILTKRGYRFDDDPVTGLKSNSITDIIVADENTVWIGTGKGLSKTTDGGKNWVTFTEKHNIGRGGVSALAKKDSILWVATAFDSLLLGEHEAVGGGLSFSTNNGQTWTHIPQPLPRPDWTIVNNVTYDIAIIGSTVWTASFGGGLMKSSDMGQTWESVSPDQYNFNPDDNLSHRVFSLLAVGDTLWVGTAGGITVSYDAGATWPDEMPFTFQLEKPTISGNFVVALGLQRLNGDNIIWAATINAEDTNEYRAISKTEDGGRNWTPYLRGKFSYNFAFSGAEVYAATDSGLWRSPNAGGHWDVFEQIVDDDDDVTREKMYSEGYYAVGVSPLPERAIWVGSDDGLAVSRNNGTDWEIFRAFVKPGVGEEPRVYAYPNPFAPMRFNLFGSDGFIRFQFNTKNDAYAKIRVFDFAMDLITTIEGGSWPSNSDCAVAWNCRDSDNHLLANGVYFYQLELEGDGKYWGKIIIID